MEAPVKDSGYAYDDYVALVSDGLNTQNCCHTNAADIDARQKLLRAKIKAAPYNVNIFTVQINTDTKNPDPTSVALQQCASDGNFQIITSASQTASAFEKITTQLSRLRIAK